MTDTPDGPNPGKVPGAELEREVAGYYEAYAVQLLRYAETHTRDLDLGKDAVQEVFLRYFAERRFGNRIENPRAWLYRVLHNHLLDRLSRAAMKCEVSADGTEHMADLQAGAEMRIEQRQTAREIEARLTPRELACIRLRVEGLSYQEIADRLGVRIGTVGALLPRVYTKLRASTRAPFSLRVRQARSFSCWVAANHMHPDIETLVAHHFGELAPPLEKSVALHVAGCAECQLELGRLGAAGDQTPPAEPPKGADTLLTKLRYWESESTETHSLGALKLRVESTLAPYLGKSAAKSLLQTVRHDGRDVLTQVAPLLTIFLGRRAAGNLVSHVVEKAIVNTQTTVRL